MAGIDLGTLFARIKLDSSEAEQGLQSFQDKAKASGESLKDTGKALMGIGAVGTASIGGLVKVGADWQAQVAGQQFAMKNLDKTVQDSITSNSKNAEAIGLTNQQYLDGATNISTYFKNMGVTAEETAKLSGASMELVADLGAITDMPFDEALGRFKSGLMGNYEALDAFNINISASSLENSEFVKSLGKSWSQLSDNEKMMATYSEIVRQGASAQGLAKQEAEQFSMKMKLLSTKVQELTGKIGQALIPILEPLVAIFENIIDKVGKWVEENQTLVGIILAVVGGLSVFLTVAGAVSFVVGSLMTFFGGLGLSMGALVGIIGAVVLGFGTVVGSSETLTQAMINFGQSLIENVIGAFTKLLEFIPKIIPIGLDMIGALIQGIFTGFPAFLSTTLNIIQGFLDNIIKNLPQFIQKGKDIIMALIQGLIERVPQWLSTMGNGIVQVLGLIAKHLPQFLQKGVDIVVRIIKGIAQNIPAIAGKMGELLGKLIAKIVEYLPQFIAKGIEIVVKLIKGLIDSIPKLLSAGKDLLEAVKDGIKAGIDGLLSVGKDIVNGLLNGIKAGWGSLKSWVGGALSKLNPFKSIEVDTEIKDPSLEGLQARKPFFNNPSMFGINARRTFDTTTPKRSSDATSGLQEAKEVIINTVVELEGYQIAKASARYMQEELSNINRKATRLGGVL